MPGYLWGRTIERHFVQVPMPTLTDRLIAMQQKVALLVGEHKALHARANELEVEAHEHRRTVEVLKARVT